MLSLGLLLHVVVPGGAVNSLLPQHPGGKVGRLLQEVLPGVHTSERPLHLVCHWRVKVNRGNQLTCPLIRFCKFLGLVHEKKNTLRQICFISLGKWRVCDSPFCLPC